LSFWIHDWLLLLSLLSNHNKIVFQMTAGEDLVRILEAQILLWQPKELMKVTLIKIWWNGYHSLRYPSIVFLKSTFKNQLHLSPFTNITFWRIARVLYFDVIANLCGWWFVLMMGSFRAHVSGAKNAHQ